MSSSLSLSSSSPFKLRSDAAVFVPLSTSSSFACCSTTTTHREATTLQPSSIILKTKDKAERRGGRRRGSRNNYKKNNINDDDTSTTPTRKGEGNIRCTTTTTSGDSDDYQRRLRHQQQQHQQKHTKKNNPNYYNNNKKKNKGNNRRGRGRRRTNSSKCTNSNNNPTTNASTAAETLIPDDEVNDIQEVEEEEFPQLVVIQQPTKEPLLKSTSNDGGSRRSISLSSPSSPWFNKKEGTTGTTNSSSSCSLSCSLIERMQSIIDNDEIDYAESDNGNIGSSSSINNGNSKLEVLGSKISKRRKQTKAITNGKDGTQKNNLPAVAELWKTERYKNSDGNNNYYDIDDDVEEEEEDVVVAFSTTAGSTAATTSTTTSSATATMAEEMDTNNNNSAEVVERPTTMIIQPWDDDDNNNNNNNSFDLKLFRAAARRRKGRLQDNRAKVRDRWWELLVEHRRRRDEKYQQQQQQQQQKEEEEASSFLASVRGTENIPEEEGEEEEEQHQQNATEDFNRSSTVVEGTEPPSSLSYSCHMEEAIRLAIMRDDREGLHRSLQLLSSRQHNQYGHQTDAADEDAGVFDRSCNNFSDNDNNNSNNMTPIQLAIHLDRPHILRMLLSNNSIIRQEGEISKKASSGSLPALLMASKLGHEECIQQLLLECGTVPLLTTKDSQGNNALHICCREGHLPILQYFLDCLPSVLSKLFLSKNDQGQTPLHVSCQYGRTHVVEAILENASLSVLSRLLAIQDEQKQTPLLAAVSSNSTDTVMSLFMWRGNNYYRASSSLHQQQQQGKEDVPCPMAWAVQHSNIDMVLLLLEFNSPSGKGYNLTQALLAAVKQQDGDWDEPADNEMVRVLIEAGANPCCQGNDTGNTSQASEVPCAAVVVAAERHDVSCLATLLSSYDNYLERVRRKRRRDPVLQKQPNSFFAGMESRENAERKTAMRGALVTALYYASKKGGAYHECTEVLYGYGGNLELQGLERLKASLSCGRLLPASSVTPLLGNRREVCSYKARVGSISKEESAQRSRLLMSLAWIRVESYEYTECCSIPTTEEVLDYEVLEPDVVLVSEDGFRFLAHSVILADKSAKLAAAIHFASMSESSTDSFIEIKVAASKRSCKWMIQHIYHGSIAFGLPSDPYDLAQDLLDLLVVAQEVICPSLIQECETRLLSSEPRQCFCCSCASRLGTNDGTYFYCVSGPSSCIAPSTVLDILALSLSLSEVCQDMCSYTIDVDWNDTPLALWSPWKDAVTVRPLECLREAVARCILLQFYSVTASDAFASSLIGSDGEMDSLGGSNNVKAKEMLLKMCLDELVNWPQPQQQPPNKLVMVRISRKGG